MYDISRFAESIKTWKNLLNLFLEVLRIQVGILLRNLLKISDISDRYGRYEYPFGRAETERYHVQISDGTSVMWLISFPRE
jgi:hypothetical protein